MIPKKSWRKDDFSTNVEEKWEKWVSACRKSKLLGKTQLTKKAHEKSLMSKSKA
jgi:hypothetical protein